MVAKLRRFLDGCVRRPEAPASSTRSVLDEVLAVLVLYRQDLAQSPTYLSLGGKLRRLGAQLDLLVYDNSEQASSLPENAPADGWRISYQHDGTNPGVSRAYVEGARLGASRGKRWLLLLDQDTVFPPGALDAYVDAVRRHPDARLFAPILRVAGRVASPCGYRFKRGRPLEGPAGHARVSRPIGGEQRPLIGLEAYLAAGGHDPRIPLDFADHEFIARYKRRSDWLVTVDVECRRSLSASQPARPAAVVERFRYYCLGARTPPGASGMGFSPLASSPVERCCGPAAPRAGVPPRRRRHPVSPGRVMTARDREVGPLISALLFVTLAELMLLGSGRLIRFGLRAPHVPLPDLPGHGTAARAQAGRGGPRPGAAEPRLWG